MKKTGEDPVSASEPDWTREGKAFFQWAPSRSLLSCIRQYNRHSHSKNAISRFVMKVAVVRHRFWSVVTGADIPINCEIGGGLLMPHPNGIVIHPDSTIGINCLILQQVTIGVREGSGVPRIGNHVDLGAGSKILGAVVIGDHVRVGANAVVLIDLATGSSAVGIPAKVISTHEISPTV